MIPRRWAVPQVLPRFCFLMLEQRHFFDAFLQCKVFMEAYIRSGFWSGSLGESCWTSVHWDFLPALRGQHQSE